MICVSIDAGPLSAEIGRHRFGLLPQVSVYGTSTRPLKMAAQGGVSIGIGVSPVGWARLGLGSAIEAQNRVVPLAGMLGDALAGDLAARLAGVAAIGDIAPTLDAIFAPLLAKPHPDEPLILALAAIITTDGNPDVADAALPGRIEHFPAGSIRARAAALDAPTQALHSIAASG